MIHQSELLIREVYPVCSTVRRGCSTFLRFYEIDWFKIHSTFIQNIYLPADIHVKRATFVLPFQGAPYCTRDAVRS